jgi:putative flippase GtrA
MVRIKKIIEDIVERLIALLILVIISFLVWFVTASIILPIRIVFITYLSVMAVLMWRYVYEKWPWQ